MLDFVWHLRGSIALDGVGANEVTLERLQRLLERQRKSVSQRGSECLAFDDPLWKTAFGPNWYAMLIYDRGRFWIEQGTGGRKLRYDLRSLHGMFFCLFAALTAFLFGFADDGLFRGLKFAAAAFAWLYGMNILLAVVRVPSSIRNAVSGA